MRAIRDRCVSEFAGGDSAVAAVGVDQRLLVNLEPEVPHRFTPLMLENSCQWFAKFLKP